MTAADMPVQLDLFGEVEQQLDRRAVLEQARREWEAQFERADWVAPYDCGHGPEGTVVAGWRCPDAECGEVADNAYTLWINHGFDPEAPGAQPYHGRCRKVRVGEGGPCPVCGGQRRHFVTTYPERPCLIPAHAQRVGGRRAR